MRYATGDAARAAEAGDRPLALRGKSGSVAAFRLLEVHPTAPGVARRLDSPLVGRERELGLLRQAFDRAVSERACHLFTVLGAAGVGKSRLVEEFLAEVPGARVLRGRCLAYGEGITFFPVVEVLKQATGALDFEDPAVVERKICEVVAGEEHGEAVCARLGHLLGLEEGEAVPDETFWAIRRFLETLARERPLVVVFDDVQWGEATFLDLVEHVADWTRDAPILLVCLARPELLDVRTGWGGGKLNATSILLEPLPEDQCERLVANLLGAEFFVVHPGACPAERRGEGVARLVRGIEEALAEVSGPTKLLLENQGSRKREIAADLAELSLLLDRLDPERVGVCFDTCHAFVAGYDLRTPTGWTDTLAFLSGHGGLDRLKIIHANDAKGELGSGIDRHEHIGQGYLGDGAFAAMGEIPGLADLAVILETPQEDPEDDPRNLAAIRRLTAGRK